MEIKYLESHILSLIGNIKILQIILIFSCLQETISSDEQSRPPLKLTDILPKDYDSFQTPKYHGSPADVSIQIEILNIRSVNVKDMSFIGDIFLYNTWRDPRLNYPKNISLPQIALNPQWRKELWTPDVYFHNALEGKVQDTIIPYVFLNLWNDSTVVFGARLSLLFSCDMLLHNFPHDKQTCDIIVKSLTHSTSDMNLHWSGENPLTIGDYYLLPQFDYLPPIATNCTDVSKLGKHGEFACLRGVIKLRRRTGYYVINIYIPSILIVFMSMLTFWIPPDAVPGRVTLGVTSLLTIITKQYQASLPNVSYIVALNIWLSCCIGFVFCSLLEYASVIALFAHKKRIREAANLAAEKGIGTNVQSTRNLWTKLEDTVMSWVESQESLKIDRTSRAVFPAAFAIQCIAYWAYYAR